jgi:HSP20 family protein
MTLIPWESMKNIEDMLDRYSRALPWNRANSWPLMAEWNPRVDISETDGTYLIKADIPGVAKNDLKVRLDQGVLTIQGERHQEQHEDHARLHRLERFYGNFTRSFTLPDDAEASGLVAEAHDGQLTVSVPKKVAAPSAAAIQIPVS